MAGEDTSHGNTVSTPATGITLAMGMMPVMGISN